uniref:RRM domain-containing protein n=1 Tax=Zooxanthella nutricula TaxID=1333877 RepID=A0A7S2NVZ2_9DINO
MPANKITDPEKVMWLGQIPEGTKDQDILAVAKQVGNAKWAEVWGSKGTTAVVGFDTPEEAQAAIAAMNGAQIGGAAVVADKYTGTGKPRSGGKGKGKWSSNGNKWSGSWKGGGGSDMMGFVMGMMAQMMKGKGKGGKGGYGRPKISTNGKFVVDDSGGVLGEFVGTIRSYHDGKCYGFIECADLEPHGYKDVFLHGDMKKGYRVGHKVKFTAFLTKEGKCQAKELKSGLK